MNKKTAQAPADHVRAVPSTTDKTRASNRTVLAEMKDRCLLLVQWASQLAGRGGNLVDAAVLSVAGDTVGPVFRVQLFTQSHRYTIAARPPCGDDDGYLGCTASARTPLAGEDWTRGNDLADGPYSDATWIEIVYSILGYELVRLGK